MGIDVYSRWKNQTQKEHDDQCTGFSIHHGHVGYLREAYHGQPYATRMLVPEAFAADSDDDEPMIPAATMRKRLPGVIAAAIERAKNVYKEEIDENDPTVKSFVHFVELCEAKERETGIPCRIFASY